MEAKSAAVLLKYLPLPAPVLPRALATLSEGVRAELWPARAAALVFVQVPGCADAAVETLTAVKPNSGLRWFTCLLVQGSCKCRPPNTLHPTLACSDKRNILRNCLVHMVPAELQGNGHLGELFLHLSHIVCTIVARSTSGSGTASCCRRATPAPSAR